MIKLELSHKKGLVSCVWFIVYYSDVEYEIIKYYENYNNACETNDDVDSVNDFKSKAKFVVADIIKCLPHFLETKFNIDRNMLSDLQRVIHLYYVDSDKTFILMSCKRIKDANDSLFEDALIFQFDKKMARKLFTVLKKSKNKRDSYLALIGDRLVKQLSKDDDIIIKFNLVRRKTVDEKDKT